MIDERNITEREPIKEQMPVKIKTFEFPYSGAKWKTRTKTMTITEATYSKNAEE